MLSAGLTGGIASGKSLAAKLFQKLGAYLIDADAISLEVVKPGREGWERIVKNFGPDIVEKNGAIDRVKLGSIVFSDAEKRRTLNNLLHPLIIEKINKELKHVAVRNPFCIVVVEMPLLFECGLQKDFDKIVVVSADRGTQKKRLMERNGLKEKEAEERLNSQMDLNEKKKFADYIIENN
ncbi:unnamed protein product, partial [marine sediment metagenome]